MAGPATYYGEKFNRDPVKQILEGPYSIVGEYAHLGTGCSNLLDEEVPKMDLETLARQLFVYSQTQKYKKSGNIEGNVLFKFVEKLESIKDIYGQPVMTKSPYFLTLLVLDKLNRFEKEVRETGNTELAGRVQELTEQFGELQRSYDERIAALEAQVSSMPQLIKEQVEVALAAREAQSLDLPSPPVESSAPAPVFSITTEDGAIIYGFDYALGKAQRIIDTGRADLKNKAKEIIEALLPALGLSVEQQQKILVLKQAFLDKFPMDHFVY